MVEFVAQQPCPNASPDGWIICWLGFIILVPSHPGTIHQTLSHRVSRVRPHLPWARQGSSLYYLCFAVEKTLAQRGKEPGQGYYTASLWGGQCSSSGVLSNSNPVQSLRARMGSFSKGASAWQHRALWGGGPGPEQTRSWVGTSMHLPPPPSWAHALFTLL